MVHASDSNDGDAAGSPIPAARNSSSGPVAETARITTLDLIRGAAVLGILLMNVVSFKYGLVPYLNISAGDVLMVYALCSAILLAARKLSPRFLIIAGVVIYLLPIANDFWMQSIANSTDAQLIGIWTQPGADIEEAIGLGLIFNYFMRALGMMLIGAGLYRIGFMHGNLPIVTYRWLALLGIGSGLTLAALGVAFVAVNGFSRDVAFIGNTPNNLGSISLSLGYMSLLILWDRRPDNWLKQRLRAVGKMALTNYLMHSILGILILAVLLDHLTLSRSWLLLFALSVWVLQLWWSQAWLNRYRFGPAELLWRVATYRRWQQLRRA